jgi:outer membrane protein
MIALSRTLRALTFAALAALPVAGALAQELKIGYVSLERVLRDSHAAKAAQAKLEAEFGRREKELSDMANRLKAANDKLEKDGPTLAQNELGRRQRDLVEQDRDFQRRRREFQEDIQLRKSEELAGVVERANRVIKDIFEKEKFDLILQDAVHAGARVDITKRVVDALNAQK